MRKPEIMGITRHRMGIDGKGVRTLVTFYGCPLDCKYCINRHCKQEKTERIYLTPGELKTIVEIDNIYFQMTGGGITFGGGEPLSASEYIADFCRIADSNWTINIETSLYGTWEQVRRLIPHIDTWIVDIKDTDPEIYKLYTGRDNTIVMSNLMKLRANIEKRKILVRIPEIPGFNTKEDMRKSKELLNHCNQEFFKYIRI